MLLVSRDTIVKYIKLQREKGTQASVTTVGNAEELRTQVCTHFAGALDVIEYNCAQIRATANGRGRRQASSATVFTTDMVHDSRLSIIPDNSITLHETIRPKNKAPKGGDHEVQSIR